MTISVLEPTMTTIKFITFAFLIVISFINGFKLSSRSQLSRPMISTKATSINMNLLPCDKSQSIDQIAMKLIPTFSTLFLFSSGALADSNGDSDAVLTFAKPILDIFINLMNLLFLSRVIISWYPKTNKGIFQYVYQ